jgi:hypothetical protein
MRANSQATSWMFPDQIIHCQYGDIPVKKWLANEVWRIRKNPNRIAIIKEGEGHWDGQVALFVNFLERYK